MEHMEFDVDPCTIDVSDMFLSHFQMNLTSRLVGDQ